MDPIIEKIKNEINWLIRSMLIMSYHVNEQSKYENKRNNKWTVQDTANELHLSVGYVSESLKLAKAHKRGITFEGMTRENALKMIRTNND